MPTGEVNSKIMRSFGLSNLNILFTAASMKLISGVGVFVLEVEKVWEHKLNKFRFLLAQSTLSNSPFR